MKENLEDKINYYIDRLDSHDSEDAFHYLIEMPSDAIPMLINKFNEQTEPTMRAELVEVIWQMRDSSVCDFLITLLEDEEDGVWQQALDGLVALGDKNTAEKIGEILPGISENNKKHKWYVDAIDQLKEKNT